MRTARRPLSTLLAGAVVAASALTVVLGAAPASAAVSDLRINEVESTGGTPVDWIEIVNTGPEAVDVGGLRLKDNDDTRTFAIPAGTTIAPGGSTPPTSTSPAGSVSVAVTARGCSRPTARR